MKFRKLQDREGLVRDMDSSAVLNVDNEALLGYKRQKAKMNHINMLTEESSTLKNEVLEMKNEIEEVKLTLSKILTLLEK